jgi:hypothetical protein
MKLLLGVNDIPYADKTGTTTGDVAEILEARYHPMEIFYEENSQEIADLIAESYEGSLESIVMGARARPSNFFTAGTSKIEAKFKDFIATGKMEALGYPGVPTKAALKGVNHRKKHPNAKGNPRRVSFVDTGLYMASFRAEVVPE